MFFHVADEGKRYLMTEPGGVAKLIIGPCRVFWWRRRFQQLEATIANLGDYIVVHHLDGRQEHLAGPARVWFDPRIHESIAVETALKLAAKEALVVYTRLDTGKVTRRIVHGPAAFVPQPGEWLHTFSWHGADGGSRGAAKVSKGLQFQALRLMPDQMYHDIPDVRTSDDAVLTVKLMIFFELIDIEKMLDSTRDPIGDLVNAATSDIVEFVGRLSFDEFKGSTGKLNGLAVYEQLVGRAAECGYRIQNVVYRGYGAAESLQLMHNQAIDSRTQLQLEKATERQKQELDDLKLERELARSEKQRNATEREAVQEIDLREKRARAELGLEDARRTFRRTQGRLDAEQEADSTARSHAVRSEFLKVLGQLGVDLTAYLTQGHPDRIVELRVPDSASMLVHVGDDVLNPAKNPQTDGRLRLENSSRNRFDEVKPCED